MWLVIFRSMIVTSLRDKITLFYSLLFPIGLMIGLGIYFDEGTMPVRIVSGVTAISTIFWGMQGIAFQVHYQRNKGVYKLLKMTPLPILSFISIMTLARTTIGVVLNMLVWGVGVIFLNLNVTLLSVLNTFLLISIGTLCFTCIGFLLSNIAQNEGQINMYSNLLQLPMIFMSESFYSLQAAPEWVRMIGKMLPFEYYVKGLRGVLLEDMNPMILGLLIPLAFMVGALVLSVITFKWEEKPAIVQKSRKYAS